MNAPATFHARYERAGLAIWIEPTPALDGFDVCRSRGTARAEEFRKTEGEAAALFARWIVESSDRHPRCPNCGTRRVTHSSDAMDPKERVEGSCDICPARWIVKENNR